MAVVMTSDGVALHYENGGSANGIPIVLLHGWAASVRYWDSLRSALHLLGFRTIALDMRGHGGSEIGPLTHERLAMDVAELMRAAGVESAAIAGHSFGARIAQLASSIAPGMARCLVLIAGFPLSALRMTDEQSGFLTGCIGHRERMQQLAGATISPAASPASVAALVEASMQAAGGALRDVLRLSLESANAAPPAAVPALAITGSQDAICGPELIRETVLPALKSPTLHVLDCGHHIVLECPEEVASVISEFVAANACGDS